MTEHPVCCYCGGFGPTESIDHAPPKAMFIAKDRPKGNEVPACHFCNKRHSQFDGFFGLLALTIGSANSGFHDPEARRLIGSSYKLFPEAMQQLVSNARPVWRSINGIYRKQVRILFDTPEIHFVMCYQAARLAAAQYYIQTNKILPDRAKIYVSWDTTIQPKPHGFMEKFLKLAPDYYYLKQGKKESSMQYEAKFQFEPTEELGVAAFRIQRSIHLYAIIGGEGLDEDWEEHGEETLGNNLFVVSSECIQPKIFGFPGSVRLNERG